jgi:hypothetical protein
LLAESNLELILFCLVLYIETKNQWARDDPAFIVVQASFVAVSVAATEVINPLDTI